MKLLTFKYTKPDGAVSNRVFIPVITPNNMYEGTDVSELEDEQQVFYLAELANLHKEYLENVSKLNKMFDVNYKYRRFDPARMSEVITEDI